LNKKCIPEPWKADLGKRTQYNIRERKKPVGNEMDDKRRRMMTQNCSIALCVQVFTHVRSTPRKSHFNTSKSHFADVQTLTVTRSSKIDSNALLLESADDKKGF
jgi:hypothetical protein